MDVDDRRASAPPSPALPAPDPSGALDRIPPMRLPGRPLPVNRTLRPMEAEDLPFVTAEHRAHFPDGFFARLGPRFLTAYTATYIASPHARAYVAEVDGRPVAFLVGVIAPAAHRRHLVRTEGKRLALRAGAALSVRPGLALHFLRTRLVRYARKLVPVRRAQPQETGPGSTQHDGVTAVLAHVVVTDRARSLGLGAELISRFTWDAADAGCTRVSLVTAAGAGGAGRYYERLGWRFGGETRTPEGHLFAEYEYPLYAPFPDASFDHRPQGAGQGPGQGPGYGPGQGSRYGPEQGPRYGPG